jgi:hypothetical protein
METKLGINENFNGKGDGSQPQSSEDEYNCGSG